MRRGGFWDWLRRGLFRAAVTWRDAGEPDHLEANDWRIQTRGLRFTERIRDRWRKRWLRLRRDEDGQA